MSPGRGVGNGSLVLDNELFGVGLDLVEGTVLIKGKDLFAVGNHGLVLAEGLAADPLGCSVGKVDAGHALLPEMDVAESVYDDGAGHIALLLVFPFLIDRESVRVLGEVEEEGFPSITTGEDGLAEDDGGKDIHSAEGLDGSFPEDLAIAGFHARKVGPGLYDQLLDSPKLGSGGGGKGAAVHASLVVQRPPDRFPSLLLELDEAGPRLNVEMIPLDQGRADEAEGGQRRLVALHEIDRPFLAAVGGVETNQEVPHSADVRVLPIVSGCGTDPAPVFPGEERYAHGARPLGLPLLFPAGPVEGPHELVLSPGLDGEDELFGNDRAGVSLGDLTAPGLLELLLGNFLGPGEPFAIMPSRVGPRHWGQAKSSPGAEKGKACRARQRTVKRRKFFAFMVFGTDND